MTERLPLGPGHPVPSQSWDVRRSALRGEFLPQATKKKPRRWFNIKRKDRKDRAITPDRGAVIDAENRIDQYDTDVSRLEKTYSPSESRDDHGRWTAGSGKSYKCSSCGKTSTHSADDDMPVCSNTDDCGFLYPEDEVKPEAPAKPEAPRIAPPSKRLVKYRRILSDFGDDVAAYEVKHGRTLIGEVHPEQHEEDDGSTWSGWGFYPDKALKDVHEYGESKTRFGAIEDGWYGKIKRDQGLNKAFNPAQKRDENGRWSTNSSQSPESDEETYLGQHQPSDDGPPVWDLTAVGDEDQWYMPSDVYDHPDWYVGDPGSKATKETIAVLRAVRGNPDAEVTIYRSAPPHVSAIEPGNWVTLSHTYAKEHGMHESDSTQDWPVLEQKVSVKDVLFAGDDLNEFGWFPKGHVAKEFNPAEPRDEKGRWTAGSARFRPEGIIRPQFANPSEFPSVSSFGDREGFQDREMAAKVLSVCVDFIPQEDLVSLDDGEPRQIKNEDARKDKHCRSALKKRLVQAISDRMAEDPKVIQYHRDNPDPVFPDSTVKELSEAYAKTLTDSWANSAGDHSPTSWAIQRCASELFGTEDPEIPDGELPLTNGNFSVFTLKEETGIIYKRDSVMMKAYLRACYSETQEILAKNGITSMKVCRGFKLNNQLIMESGQLVVKDENSPNPYKASVGVSLVTSNPLTSWATTLLQADKFAGETGIVMSAEIPADRILSLPCSGPGCFAEDEVLVIGAEGFPVNVTPGGLLGAQGTGGQLKLLHDSFQLVKNVAKSLSSWLYIDERPQDDWPKRTPDKMSDLAHTPVAKIDPNAALNAVRALDTNALDDLVLEEIGKQAPKLSQALRRTMATITDSPEFKGLFSKWVQGDFSNWQMELEKVASVLNVNPQKLAEALEIPMLNGYNMPALAMSKTLSVPFKFEYPDMWASKWSYVHSGEMITTQSKRMVKTIRNMVSEAMNGDMTTEDLKWSLRHNINLPPRYSQAVKNYRIALRKSGMKTSTINRLSETYAQRLLLDHADTIARTEVMTALSKGQRRYWDDMASSGILPTNVIMRMWSTSKDERTCATCMPMQGKKVAYNARFELPTGVWLDETPAHPRCRCSIVMHIPEPEDLLRARR